MDLDNTNLNVFNEKGLTLSGKSIDFLLKTAPWIKFISIFWAAYMAILVLSIVVALTFVGIMMLPSLIMISITAIISFFPLMYIYKYSKYLKEACNSNSVITLENAFDMQKRFWKFYGIATIIAIGFIIIIIIFMSIFSLDILNLIQPKTF